MRIRATCLIVVFSLFFFGCGEQAEHLRGVWKVEKVINLATATTSPGDNVHYMFSDRYLMTIGGKDDRPVIENNFAQMTHGEILSQLPAGGGFMAYEIKEGKIHRTTLFAMSEYYEGKTIVTEYEVSNNTLILRDDHPTDGQLREWHMVRLE